MAFGNRSARPKQMRPNEVRTFGTKPKQLAFGNWSARPNQMGPNETKQFGTKPTLGIGTWLPDQTN